MLLLKLIEFIEEFGPDEKLLWGRNSAVEWMIATSKTGPMFLDFIADHSAVYFNSCEFLTNVDPSSVRLSSNGHELFTLDRVTVPYTITNHRGLSTGAHPDNQKISNEMRSRLCSILGEYIENPIIPRYEIDELDQIYQIHKMLR